MPRSTSTNPALDVNDRLTFERSIAFVGVELLSIGYGFFNYYYLGAVCSDLLSPIWSVVSACQRMDLLYAAGLGGTSKYHGYW